MVDRTLISLAGGVIAAVVALVGAWILLSAYERVGWVVPLAAGVAVFLALWAVDFLTDYLAERAKRKQS